MKALIRFLILFPVFGVLVNQALADTKTLSVPIVLTNQQKARDSFLVTRMVSTADLSLQTASLRTFSARPKVTIGKERALLYVGVGSFSKGTLFTGLVKLNPKMKKVPPPQLKKFKRKISKAAQFAELASAEARLPDGIARVTDRDSDFSISGPRTFPWMAIAGRDVISTGLSSAECYGKEDGFVLLDTSSEYRRARAAEISLCRSGLADRSTCFDENSYLPPNASVRGVIVSDGSTITVALSFFDESGSEAVSNSIAGDFDSFIQILESAGSDLGRKICEARGLRVSLSANAANSNHCSYTDTGRCGCSEEGSLQGFYWEGGTYTGEMKGPVGTTFELDNSAAEFNHGTINCDGWSKITCSGAADLCCRRESAQQPARTDYEAQLSFPPNPRFCHCESTDFETTLTSTVSKGSSMKSQSLNVRCVTG